MHVRFKGSSIIICMYEYMYVCMCMGMCLYFFLLTLFFALSHSFFVPSTEHRAPCAVFRQRSLVAVAARPYVFMARISANMQSDYNLLNVFFEQPQQQAKQV